MKELYRLRIFDKILSEYEFDKPLSRFLSELYRANKQMGSKDRKLASSLIFNYFRLGKALPDIAIYPRLAIACFLCENNENEFYTSLIKEFTPLDSSKINLQIADKIKEVKNHFSNFNLESIFPFLEYLSSTIDKNSFLESMLIQPKLWIRVKKSHIEKVKIELESLAIPYTIDSELINCLGLKNNTSLDGLDSFNKGYFEIQDRSSQYTCSFIDSEASQKWWDCCAASGGKSLMLLDKEPTIKVTVSDTRESILVNLQQRFSKSGIKDYAYYQIDLVSGFSFGDPKPEFDGIILDAPCTGSGTWGRTPEMISGFKHSDIKLFQHKQIQIAENVLPYLKKGGSLIYITCSIFTEENENVIKLLSEKYNLTIKASETIKGYTLGADSMFVAKLSKT
jgi:16S rRNA (cytosine967-C5)-methyltransferase